MNLTEWMQTSSSQIEDVINTKTSHNLAYDLGEMIQELQNEIEVLKDDVRDADNDVIRAENQKALEAAVKAVNHFGETGNPFPAYKSCFLKQELIDYFAELDITIDPSDDRWNLNEGDFYDC